MPKTKKLDAGVTKIETREEPKEILLDDEEKTDIELTAGDVITDPDGEEEEAEAVIDDEDINPFKDRWEE